MKIKQKQKNGGKADWVPFAQPGDQKQDCIKRNVIYENTCTSLSCNPGKEKEEQALALRLRPSSTAVIHYKCGLVRQSGST